MDILVIGNGFDLAHGLPTRYTDFLKWIGKYILYEEYKQKKPKRDKKGSVKIEIEQLKNREKHLEVLKCISNNLWIEYFLKNQTYLKENWIDLESEISRVIQSMDSDMYRKHCGLEDRIPTLSNDFLKQKFLHDEYLSCAFSTQPPLMFHRYIDELKNQKNVSFKVIRNALQNDMNKFTRLLEIYLTEYVEKKDIEIVSPDLAVIMDKSLQNEEKKINVLNFNYTNTYQRVYLNKYINDLRSDIDYIHGKADISNTVESNNMVLGIDEYLPENRKDKDIEFIAFKKYYQRIYKGTGCQYKKWVELIQNDYFEYMQKQMEADNKRYIPDKMQATMHRIAMQAIRRQLLKKHNLYIFGHSLDVTDKDILRDLILNDNVYTTIFYPDKKELGRKIANLVKVIGQDELIRRTGGSTKTIEFKLQQPMVPIED